MYETTLPDETTLTSAWSAIRRAYMQMAAKGNGRFATFKNDKVYHNGNPVAGHQTILERRPMVSKPQIALTFDDGPSNVTHRVLGALEKAGAKATFFVVGGRIARYEHELKRMAAGGFQIGNHTWDHDFISKISESELRRTIERTNEAIYKACGVTPTVMRPPSSFYNDTALAVLAEMGLPAVFWNVDPRDWETKDAQSTIDHVLNRAEDGRIIIMHDVYEQTADAVEIIVPQLISRGFDLITVDELACSRGGMRPGEIYFGF